MLQLWNANLYLYDFDHNENSSATSVDRGRVHVPLLCTISHFAQNMVRLVRFVVVFLLLGLRSDFIHAHPYNLAGDQTDACFEPSQKATAECLQQLIETYYGKSFTQYCPDFSQLLAESRCTGCPWDRLNPKKINPDIAEAYRTSSNTTELFHEPQANCAISKHVFRFRMYDGVVDYVVRLSVTGSIPILFSSGAILQYTSGSTIPTRPSFFGWELQEWIFLGAVWILFDIGVLILSISEEYYRFCDTAASNLSLVIARDLSYLILIYYSLCRSVRLRFPQTNSYRRQKPEPGMGLSTSSESRCNMNVSKSWESFVSDKEGMLWVEYLRSRKAVALCLVYGSSLAVQIISIASILGLLEPDYQEEDQALCFIRSVDVSTRTISISKLVLEPLAIILYSFGASTKNKPLLRIRYAVLALIAGGCVAIMIMMDSKSLYRPSSAGFLVWRVPLWSSVSEYAEITHAFAVSLFGLLEPLRNGSFY